MKPYDKKIVLENGKEFYGYGFGANKQVVSNIVFDTAVVGYQEAISDPAFTDTIVCMTYPLIGNYGITDEDFESKVPTLGGMIVKDYNDSPSNFRYTKTLSEVLDEYDIPGVTGVDTRTIVRIIRDEGIQKAIICDADMPYEEALKLCREYEIPTDAVSKVSSKKRWYSRTPNHKFDIVAIDCGIKDSMIAKLNEKGCNVTVVPYTTNADAILKMHPDGLFVSSGPGSAEALPGVIETVKQLKGQMPMFGVSLGHHIICLACGAKLVPMKAGHFGGNHPVKNLKTGKIYISAQGHSSVVDIDSLKDTELQLTYKNVLDGTAEGVESEESKIISVQFNPEGAAGPNDLTYLFDEFISLLEKEAE